MLSSLSLLCLNRWKLLKQKVIAYKSHEGWKVGTVWKKGVGKKYGGMLWVNHGSNRGRGGYVFELQDYVGIESTAEQQGAGIEKLIVI